MQVVSSLRSAIDSGRLEPGCKLPDERQLAEQYQVSRTTIRLALDVLGNEQLINRVHGRGTFVMDRGQRSGYLCALAVGPQDLFHLLLGPTVTILSEVTRRMGWKLSIRYESDPDKLAPAIHEVDQDSTVVAGLLLGVVKLSLLKEVVSTLRLPWVKLGGYADAVRPSPIIDNVLQDNFRLNERATQCLLDMEVRRSALLVLDKSMVWSVEAANAYAATLNFARVKPEDQQVVDLGEMQNAGSTTSLEIEQRYLDRITDVLKTWKDSGYWPEGIILPRKYLNAFELAAESDPVAMKHLRQSKLVVTDFEERWSMIPPRRSQWNVTWVLASLSPQIEQAVTRLQESLVQNHPPVCDYICRTKIISANSPAYQTLDINTAYRQEHLTPIFG